MTSRTHIRRIPAYDVATARMKSYTGAATATLLLYVVLWLPGLIANFLFYRAAQRAERLAGKMLPGVGWLIVMLWANLLWVALVVVVLLQRVAG